MSTLSMKTWDWGYCAAFVFGTLVNKASVLHSATTIYLGAAFVCMLIALVRACMFRVYVFSLYVYTC